VSFRARHATSDGSRTRRERPLFAWTRQVAGLCGLSLTPSKATETLILRAWIEKGPRPLHVRIIRVSAQGEHGPSFVVDTRKEVLEAVDAWVSRLLE
jgi:hypothetical protein